VSHAAEGSLGPAGGTLVATGGDGTKFTLTLPPDALLGDQTITLTPVSAVGGLPLSGGLVGAVQITPHGLMLQKPATLTIEPAAAGAVEAQTGFLYHQGGADFHLYPLDRSGGLTMWLTHFSTPGVGLGTDADRENVADHVPARTQAQFETLIAQMFGPNFDTAKVIALFVRYYDDIVAPQLFAAESDDDVVRDALAQARAWELFGLLLSLDHPDFNDRREDMKARSARVLRNALARAYARCVNEHTLKDIVRITVIGKTAQRMHEAGWPGFDFAPEALEKWHKCARFEVTFDSQLTYFRWWQPAEDPRYSVLEDGNWRVSAQSLVIDYTARGTAVLGWSEFSFDYVDRYPCGDEGETGSSHAEGVGTLDDTIRASLRLDLDPRETPPAGQPAPAPPDNRLDVTVGNPLEIDHGWEEGCWPWDNGNFERGRWRDQFDSFHVADDDGTLPEVVTVPVPLSAATTDLLVAKTFDRERGIGDLTPRETELTTVELRHRPAP
jgi:hypothetical protein